MIQLHSEIYGHNKTYMLIYKILKSFYCLESQYDRRIPEDYSAGQIPAFWITEFIGLRGLSFGPYV